MLLTREWEFQFLRPILFSGEPSIIIFEYYEKNEWSKLDLVVLIDGTWRLQWAQNREKQISWTCLLTLKLLEHKKSFWCQHQIQRSSCNFKAEPLLRDFVPGIKLLVLLLCWSDQQQNNKNNLWRLFFLSLSDVFLSQSLTNSRLKTKTIFSFFFAFDKKL